MTEYLASCPSERVIPEVDLIQPPELGRHRGTQVALGGKAVGLSMDGLEPIDHEVVNTPDGVIKGENMGNTDIIREGKYNAELFKQAYDAAVEAIESAKKAEGAELSDALGNVLSRIDTLGAVPYISSAPEFIGLVGAARRNITEASFYTTRGSGRSEVRSAVTNALDQAKQQLSGTLVAYHPS